MGFRRGLDGTWTAHNSFFGSSLQFKKAFVSALLVISYVRAAAPPPVAANNGTYLLFSLPPLVRRGC